MTRPSGDDSARRRRRQELMGTERGVRAGVGPEPEGRASPLSCSDRSSWSAKLASTCTGSSVSSHSRWRVNSSACSSVPLCVNFTAEKQCSTQHAYNTDNASGISANTLGFFLYLFSFLRFFLFVFFLLHFFFIRLFSSFCFHYGPGLWSIPFIQFQLRSNSF